MANFICSTNPSSTEELLNLCEWVADSTNRNAMVPMNLRVTALNCWALLCTTISEQDLASSYIDDDDNHNNHDDDDEYHNNSQNRNHNLVVLFDDDDDNMDHHQYHSQNHEIKPMGRGFGLLHLLKDCLDTIVWTYDLRQILLLLIIIITTTTMKNLK